MNQTSFTNHLDDSYKQVMRITASIQRLKLLTPEAIEGLEDFSTFSKYVILHVKNRAKLHVVRACFGKLNWKKRATDDGAMNYETNDGTVSIIIRCSEIPPSCRIVEEEVIIPAREAYTETRKVVKCLDESDEENGKGWLNHE